MEGDDTGSSDTKAGMVSLIGFLTMWLIIHRSLWPALCLCFLFVSLQVLLLQILYSLGELNSTVFL